MAVQSTTYAYHIGDIGPGGGMVFALPNTGPNSTNYYYEITTTDQHNGKYQDDLSAVCSPGCYPRTSISISQTSIFPGTNSSNPFSSGNPYVFITANQLTTAGSSIADLQNLLVSVFSPYQSGIGTLCPPYISYTSLPPGGTWPPFPVEIIGWTMVGSSVICLELPSTYGGVLINPTVSYPWDIVFNSYNYYASTSQLGVEWNALGVLGNQLYCPSAFGSGANNTADTVAYINTNNLTPSVTGRSIAAIDADTYSVTGIDPNTGLTVDFDDWFVPSFRELKVALNRLGPGAPGNNAVSGDPLDNIANFDTVNHTRYWTSSNWNGGANSNGFNKAKVIDVASSGWNFVSNTATHPTYRCHTYNIRYVRRFKAEPEREERTYNYRDCVMDPSQWHLNPASCNWMLPPGTEFIKGTFHPGSAGSAGCVSEQKDGSFLPHDGLYWQGTGNTSGTVTVDNYLSSSILPAKIGGKPFQKHDGLIGMNYFKFFINRYDAMGYFYSNDSFNEQTGVPITISIWDNEGKFLGKWRYDNIVDVTPAGNATYSSHNSANIHCNIGFGNQGRNIILTLSGVTQLDGPTNQFGTYTEPVVNYGGGQTGHDSKASLYALNAGVAPVDANGTLGLGLGQHYKVHPFYEGTHSWNTNSGAFIKVESLMMTKAKQMQVNALPPPNNVMGGLQYPHFAKIDDFNDIYAHDSPVICTAIGETGLAQNQLPVKQHSIIGRTRGFGRPFFNPPATLPGANNGSIHGYQRNWKKEIHSSSMPNTICIWQPHSHLQHGPAGSIGQTYPSVNQNNMHTTTLNTTFMYGCQSKDGTKSIYNGSITVAGETQDTLNFQHELAFVHHVHPWWCARELNWFDSSNPTCPVPAPDAVKIQNAWYPNFSTYLNARGWSDFTGQLPPHIHNFESLPGGQLTLQTHPGGLSGGPVSQIYPEFNPGRHGDYLRDKWFVKNPNDWDGHSMSNPLKTRLYLTTQHNNPINNITLSVQGDIHQMPGNQTSLPWTDHYAWLNGHVDGYNPVTFAPFVVVRFYGQDFTDFVQVQNPYWWINNSGLNVGPRTGNYFAYGTHWTNPCVIYGTQYTDGILGGQSSSENFFGAADCTILLLPMGNPLNPNFGGIGALNWNDPIPECDFAYRDWTLPASSSLTNNNSARLANFNKIKIPKIHRIVRKIQEAIEPIDISIDNDISEISIDNNIDESSSESPPENNTNY